MMRSMKDLENYAIGASDGPIGEVSDFFFDDEAWVIRYLVVETGSWLNSRRVLISPISIRHANWSERLLPVAITQSQVRNSPDIDTHKPVSRQHETEFLGYYGYPAYWGGEGLWGEGLYPYALLPGYPVDTEFLVEQHPRDRDPEAEMRAERARQAQRDPHLRSCKAVIGYHIHAIDGEIGHVEDLLVDEETWAVRFLVVNTSNWWLGHKVLVATRWIDGVHWSDESVSVDLSRQSVKDAPAYDSAAALNQDAGGPALMRAADGRPEDWQGGAYRYDAL
jgi:sporulation protein YlmC with PRC-barrel domain